MKKLYFITFLILLIALGAGLAYQNAVLSQLNPTPTPPFIPLTGVPTVAPTMQQSNATPSAQPSPTTNTTITFTNAGYTPSTLTVKAGTLVTFINESTQPTWPASAFHPTHKVYPGSDIAKCGTAEEATIFDACRGITPGKEWSFLFIQKGTWRYHDHFNPTLNGTIVVE